MKRIWFLAVFIFLAMAPWLASAQSLLELDKGEISFVSDAPLELISASTTDFKMLVDTGASEFAIRIPISGFTGFNSALQQEHFYENYMETDKYATASFTGKILSPLTYQPDTFAITVKGDLKIHGQTAMRVMEVNCLWADREHLEIQSEFIVPLADHGIEIPRIVYQKIAEEISVRMSGTLTFRKD